MLTKEREQEIRALLHERRFSLGGIDEVYNRVMDLLEELGRLRGETLETFNDAKEDFLERDNIIFELKKQRDELLAENDERNKWIIDRDQIITNLKIDNMKLKADQAHYKSGIDQRIRFGQENQRLKVRLEKLREYLDTLEFRLKFNADGKQPYGGHHSPMEEFQSIWAIAYAALAEDAKE